MRAIFQIRIRFDKLSSSSYSTPTYLNKLWLKVCLDTNTISFKLRKKSLITVDNFMEFLDFDVKKLSYYDGIGKWDEWKWTEKSL